MHEDVPQHKLDKIRVEIFQLKKFEKATHLIFIENKRFTDFRFDRKIFR